MLLELSVAADATVRELIARESELGSLVKAHVLGSARATLNARLGAGSEDLRRAVEADPLTVDATELDQPMPELLRLKGRSVATRHPQLLDAVERAASDEPDRRSLAAVVGLDQPLRANLLFVRHLEQAGIYQLTRAANVPDEVADVLGQARPSEGTRPRDVVEASGARRHWGDGREPDPGMLWRRPERGGTGER